MKTTDPLIVSEDTWRHFQAMAKRLANRKSLRSYRPPGAAELEARRQRQKRELEEYLAANGGAK